jgi:hypothetical protein
MELPLFARVVVFMIFYLVSGIVMAKYCFQWEPPYEKYCDSGLRDIMFFIMVFMFSWRAPGVILSRELTNLKSYWDGVYALRRRKKDLRYIFSCFMLNGCHSYCIVVEDSL